MRQFTGSASMTRLACGLLALALGCWLGSGTALAGKSSGGSTTQTGHGLIVDGMLNQISEMRQNNQYDYDLTAAAGFFTNAWNGTTPTGVCNTGGGCGTTTAPTAPTAPAPLQSELDAVVKSNACTFLDGGTLAGSAYQQILYVDVTVQIGTFPNGSPKYKTYQYKYTYQYFVSVNQSSVAPLTAWVLTATDVTLAKVKFQFHIAGLSAMKKPSDTKPKYSWSLRNADGTFRVSNVTLTLTPASTGVAQVINLDSVTSLEENCAGCLPGMTGALDFSYNSFVTMSGTTTLLPTQGDARTILNTDVFAGNDNGGSDGTALARTTSNINLELPADSYTVTLTATAKDTTGTIADALSVTGSVQINANCKKP